MTVDILGRPELKEVVTAFGHFREYVEINVPLFGHHRKGLTALKAAFHAIGLVRGRQYEYCINMVGDIRENSIGRATGAKWNIAPVWERGHLFKRKMTDTGAAWLTNRGILIPSGYASYYDSIHHFANQLGLPGLEWKTVSDRREKPKKRMNVALHPGASHASRHWPEDRWRALIQELYVRGYEIKVLGARLERSALLAAFSKEVSDNRIELVTEDIPRFVLYLAAADVLIGMDSFSVHAAYALGVPVVLLNGSADPSIMTPPGGLVTSAGHLCAQFPCYYAYPCRRTESEYICVRGIELVAVMNALEAIVERARGAHVTKTRGDN
jgi:heptosyltransferase-3